MESQRSGESVFLQLAGNERREAQSAYRLELHTGHRSEPTGDQATQGTSQNMDSPQVHVS